MQGYGLFTLEELLYSPKGVLYTRGPGSYKIPGFSDIPKNFTVSLLKGSENPRAVYSSKVRSNKRKCFRFKNKYLRFMFQNNYGAFVYRPLENHRCFYQLRFFSPSKMQSTRLEKTMLLIILQGISG